MTVRITKNGVQQIGGTFLFEKELQSDVNGVARQMRRAARHAADAAEHSLKRDLRNHVRSGELYRSIQSVVQKEAPNVYSATTSVGLDVEHSIYFFEDTRKGVRDLFSGAERNKRYGPTNDGRGPQYLRYFKGYKGHKSYIRDAQRASRAVIVAEVAKINNS